MHLIITSLIMLTLLPSYCYAAWFVQKEYNQQMISNDRYEFNLGDVNCVITQTEFTRIPNDTSITEHRELICWTSKDTNVSIAANCDPPFSVVSFTIKKKNHIYSPSLWCRP